MAPLITVALSSLGYEFDLVFIWEYHTHPLQNCSKVSFGSCGLDDNELRKLLDITVDIDVMEHKKPTSSEQKWW